ncbi:MAG: helix-turn-helix transcriptional regulator [Lawsonibacter sp.]|nr:helix-turn-helix transcriptional regulator [Lawsonibacter sp.]
MLKDIVYTIDHDHPTFTNLVRSHTHDSLEITLCLSNGGTFCVEDKFFPVTCGTLVIIQGGTKHYCITDLSTFVRYSIRIPYHTIEALSSLQTDFKPILSEHVFSTTLSAEQISYVVSHADACLACGSGFGEDLQKNIYFMQIILYIGKLLRFISIEKDFALSREYKKVLPAIQYIHTNYSEEITIQQLSDLCYMSKYYLSHIFHRATGFSVKSYIANYRIRQACELFNQGLSVQEVGSSVGFNNISYFIQVFKRIVGTTPGHFAANQN